MMCINHPWEGIYVKNRFLIGIYLTALLLGMIAGCTKEKCVVCPPDQPPAEKEYYFIYGYGAYGEVYTYSTKTGQIVDSVKYPVGFFDARFSKDGKYAYYTAQRPRISDPPVTWIEEFATRDTLSILDGIGGYWLSVSSDGRYLLISATTKLALLEIPSLNVVYQKDDGRLWLYGAIHPSKNVAYVPIKGVDSLLIIDFRASAIRDSMVPLFNGDGIPTRGNSVAITNDGKTMIIGHGQLRDAETLEFLKEFHHSASIGPYFHPDGERVFFLQYQELDVGQQGEVWELNLKTLFMTRILREADFAAYSPYFAFSPCDMDFTPEGKYALIVNGGAGHDFGVGVILKLDCDTYRIVDAIYPPPFSISQLIRINPKEIGVPETH
jgi:hypothetical protein